MNIDKLHLDSAIKSYVKERLDKLVDYAQYQDDMIEPASRLDIDQCKIIADLISGIVKKLDSNKLLV